MESGLHLLNSDNLDNIDPSNLGLQLTDLVEKLLLFGMNDLSHAWDICQYMSKYHGDIFSVHYDLIQSVGLPQTNTGRFRCFIRLLLIENKFLHLWHLLLKHKKLVQSHYNQWSMIRSKEYHCSVTQIFCSFYGISNTTNNACQRNQLNNNNNNINNNNDDGIDIIRGDMNSDHDDNISIYNKNGGMSEKNVLDFYNFDSGDIACDGIQIPINFETLDEFSFEFDSFGIIHSCQSREKTCKLQQLDKIEMDEFGFSTANNQSIESSQDEKKSACKKQNTLQLIMSSFGIKSNNNKNNNSNEKDFENDETTDVNTHLKKHKKQLSRFLIPNISIKAEPILYENIFPFPKYMSQRQELEEFAENEYKMEQVMFDHRSNEWILFSKNPKIFDQCRALFDIIIWRIPVIKSFSTTNDNYKEYIENRLQIDKDYNSKYTYDEIMYVTYLINVFSFCLNITYDSII